MMKKRDARIDITALCQQVGNVQWVEDQLSLSFPKEELELAGPVETKLKLTYTGETILVEGTLTSNVSLLCSRCNERFTHLISAEIEEEYRKENLQPEEGEEEGETEGAFYIEDEKAIDLSELARQNLILSLPSQPLCRPDCPGIREKPENKKGEDVKQPPFDPRLAKLKELKGR